MKRWLIAGSFLRSAFVLGVWILISWHADARGASLRDLLADADLTTNEVYISSRSDGWGALFDRMFGRGEAFKQSYALVIGINDYQSDWPQLSAAKNDPIRMRDHLIHRARFDAVITLTNERATKARIQYLMEDVFPEIVGSRDRLLFYFSGHGTQRAIGDGVRGYLPLTASGLSYSKMISMGEIQAWDRLLQPARQVLFLLDSCFSGLAGVQPKASLKKLPIDRLTGYAHHLISAGTGDQETIASESRWGGSIFTDSFLRGIAGSADTSTSEFDRDGVISLAELEEYISRRIQRETRGLNYRITPQVYDLSGDNEGEFFFIADDRQQKVTASSNAVPGDLVTQSGGSPSATRVLGVQQKLIDLGFQPGVPDGIIGPRTLAAVDAFLQSIGEPRSGKLTSAEEQQIATAHADRNTQRAELQMGNNDPSPTFRDCSFCPEMVVVPGGSFLMGSPADEEGRDDDEGPQHEVQIKRFALGIYEITRGEFERFVAATNHEAAGCYHWDDKAAMVAPGTDLSWRSPGFTQTDREPVICVSFEDVKAYLAWLSEVTGEPYRLPSEAEWEYAARAGTQTSYFWGNDAHQGCAFANGPDANLKTIRPQWAAMNCDDGHVRTAPVGSYQANRFGLYDMAGNVWELVEDQFHDSYSDAPSDGSSWGSGNYYAVRRGGDWERAPWFMRSASRWGGDPNGRDVTIGFRAAKTIE